MWKRFIKSNAKKTPGAGFAVSLVLFYAQLSFAQGYKSQVIFMDAESKDTLDVQDLDENSTFIPFQSSKLKYKYDVVLLKKQDGFASIVINVPARKGKLNRYYFVKENSYIPFSLENEAEKKYLAFGGNDYLDAYNQLIAPDSLDKTPSESEREQYLQKFVNKFAAFEAKFPNAQIIGYHLMYVKPDLEQKFPGNEANKVIAKILENKTGFYYDRIRQQDKNRQNSNCITNRPDTLIFQSLKSKMDLQADEKNVHVLVFWATWCGPCKAVIKQMNELNKTCYADSPVYFDAVTSEQDLMKAYTYYKDHPDFGSLGFFNDSEQCMQANYNITKLPTVLIFDKENKLVARDPEPETVKLIVDQLILKP